LATSRPVTRFQHVLAHGLRSVGVPRKVAGTDVAAGEDLFDDLDETDIGVNSEVTARSTPE
jgi:hypothetical protein